MFSLVERLLCSVSLHLISVSASLHLTGLTDTAMLSVNPGTPLLPSMLVCVRRDLFSEQKGFNPTWSTAASVRPNYLTNALGAPRRALSLFQMCSSSSTYYHPHVCSLTPFLSHLLLRQHSRCGGRWPYLCEIWQHPLHGLRPCRALGGVTSVSPSRAKTWSLL